MLENKIIKGKKKKERKGEEIRSEKPSRARARREKFQSSGLIKESNERGIEIVRIVVSRDIFAARVFAFAHFSLAWKKTPSRRSTKLANAIEISSSSAKRA